MPLMNGIATGLFLQLAIGPVFFYVLGIAIDSSFPVSLAGILGVTAADYLYIVLSILGIGKLMEREGAKRVFGALSPVVLVAFGLVFIKGAVGATRSVTTGSEWTAVKAFAGCFTLTISSPLTIVFWSGVFAAKAAEKNYSKRELTLFGLGAGSSTLLFLSAAMLLVSGIKRTIPPDVISTMNIAVGVVIILYGVRRFMKRP